MKADFIFLNVEHYKDNLKELLKTRKELIEINKEYARTFRVKAIRHSSSANTYNNIRINYRDLPRYNDRLDSLMKLIDALI
jgi:adenine C2-methylase RlmN of 23S rRNA A2503 and tRNA A37